MKGSDGEARSGTGKNKGVDTVNGSGRIVGEKVWEEEAGDDTREEFKEVMKEGRKGLRRMKAVQEGSF